MNRPISNLNDQIQEFRATQEQVAHMQQREHNRLYAEAIAAQVRFNTFVSPHLLAANPDDYLSWLKGFLSNGGQPTHSYDYPFSRQADKYFLAFEDIGALPALYGANSVSIIVQQNVYIHSIPDGVGHSNLYFKNDFSFRGIVPIFSDTKL